VARAQHAADAPVGADEDAAHPGTATGAPGSDRAPAGRADGMVADPVHGSWPRSRVDVVERTPDEDPEQRCALATDLRAALADEAVRLEYQPIVDLRSGAVAGLEALARWTHSEHGPVAPSRFVTVAELSGVAPELDRRVVRRALHDGPGC
jgi:hypothetical protein